MKPLGLLAGNGRFPFLVAQEAQRNGRRVVAIAFNGEADPALEQFVDTLHWVYVGQFNKWIKICQKEGVDEVVMAGLVRHSSMYEDFKRFHPDMRALKIFWRLKDRKADTILGAPGKQHDALRCGLFQIGKVRLEYALILLRPGIGIGNQFGPDWIEGIDELFFLFRHCYLF